MSGHSKWNNIKNKKAASDAKKAKEFTVVSRLIMNAVKKSGVTDPTMNPTLRLALDKARAINMPNANVERAISRGAGKGEGGNTLEEIVYEGYGPHGIGFIVLSHTDNKQRTGSEIRFLFSSYGGSLAGPGAAGYLFTPQEGEYAVALPVELEESQYEEVVAFAEALEEQDDVDGVWHNAVVRAHA